MKINLITNHVNGAGLQRDSDLIDRMLREAGHQVVKIQFNDWNNHHSRADLNIFLEVLEPNILSWSPVNYVIVNSEWWFSNVWDRWIPRINKFIVKTRDGENIWRAKVGANKTQFLGFEANDFYKAEVKRERRFIHAAGKSLTKNTSAVLQAWKQHRLPFPLTVLTFKPEFLSEARGIPNVEAFDRVSDERLIELMNSHQFYVCPSKMEGYGHYIHEALACGGVVLTTNAAPMNEFSGIERDLLLPTTGRNPVRCSYFYEVDIAALADKVRKAADLSDERIADISRAARVGYLADREAFRKTFSETLAKGYF